jgi:polar amino acid transport system substrate-binding protein
MRILFCCMLFSVMPMIAGAQSLRLLTEHFPPYNYQDGQRVT